MTIGCIGQGWIGKNYADHFEDRGFSVVRYAKEASYNKNREKIASCDIVFIAVPTPTTAKGFDDRIVREVAGLVGRGKIAVIKSTLSPGTTRSIQKEHPDIIVIHSPEFLREASARADVDNPDRNIIGIPSNGQKWQDAAQKVFSVLPKTPYQRVCTSEEAEITKYGGNIFLFWKVIYTNMLYDTAVSLGCDWDTIVENMTADPRIGKSHMQPVHQSGRGAGGHCFIKDFATFTQLYEQSVGDKNGLSVLEALRNKNMSLLTESGKDINLLRGVYGDSFMKS